MSSTFEEFSHLFPEIDSLFEVPPFSMDDSSFADLFPELEAPSAIEPPRTSPEFDFDTWQYIVADFNPHGQPPLKNMKQRPEVTRRPPLRTRFAVCKVYGYKIVGSTVREDPEPECRPVRNRPVSPAKTAVHRDPGFNAALAELMSMKDSITKMTSKWGIEDGLKLEQGHAAAKLEARNRMKMEAAEERRRQSRQLRGDARLL
jgi:hypothetical protein